jgi:hypothetical protein
MSSSRRKKECTYYAKYPFPLERRPEKPESREKMFADGHSLSDYERFLYNRKEGRLISREKSRRSVFAVLE